MHEVSTPETPPTRNISEKYSKEFRIKGKRVIENKHNVNIGVLAALFLSGVSGISALIGFGSTLASARKQDPTNFGKGFTYTKELPETGANLALRALGWGTLYAVTGCGLFFYAVWKISGARNVPIIYSIFLQINNNT